MAYREVRLISAHLGVDARGAVSNIDLVLRRRRQPAPTSGRREAARRIEEARLAEKRRKDEAFEADLQRRLRHA